MSTRFVISHSVKNNIASLSSEYNAVFCFYYVVCHRFNSPNRRSVLSFFTFCDVLLWARPRGMRPFRSRPLRSTRTYHCCCNCAATSRPTRDQMGRPRDHTVTRRTARLDQPKTRRTVHPDLHFTVRLDQLWTCRTIRIDQRAPGRPS